MNNLGGAIMRILLFSLTLLCAVLPAVAQDKSKEEIEREKRFQEEASNVNKDTTVLSGWKHTAATGLNLSEMSFTNWAAGGENALSYTLWVQGRSALYGERTVWKNSYKFAFGQARLADAGLRKTDDEIYVETFLVYKIGTTINPYAAATLRTQFAPGYSYIADVGTKVSKFFDPAYITQSAGAAYQPLPGLSTRVGLALREVVTSVFTQYANDANTTDVKKVRVNGGLESVSELSTMVVENVGLVARLELFSPFDAMDRIIVRNDYAVIAKVNEYITTNLTLNLINDVTVTPRTQVKQALTLGVTYNLL